MPLSLINPNVLGRLDEFHSAFTNARPFRHVVIDDFFLPEVAEAMLRDFPSVDDPSQLLNEFGGPNPKSAISDVKSLAPVFVDVDTYIQGGEFLGAMEKMTGIPDLRYDPWYYGAGTHENFHGAGLDAHYDFNIHPKTAYHRRLNAIIYLNKDWDPSWRGEIAFHTDPWDLNNDVKKTVTPDFNRCVVFETTENSWHSVAPVNLPEDQREKSRKSLTIYLYTADRPNDETAPEHGTVYVQPGLPDHIREGRTLTAADMAEINENLSRRHTYLRYMYKREYRFSEVIDDLKRQIAEWKSTSYIPLMGLAKVKRVAEPLYHDGWMGSELRADIELHQDVTAVTAEVWLPDEYAGELGLSFSFGAASTQVQVGPGLTTINLPVAQRCGDTTEIALVAHPTRVAAENDRRQISVILDNIRLAK